MRSKGKDFFLIFAKSPAIKKDRYGLVWWTAGDAQYEAHAGRQADAEWPKLKVCDLDLSGVRHAEQGQRFDNLCKVSGNKKKTEMVFFWWTAGDSNPGPTD